MIFKEFQAQIKGRSAGYAELRSRFGLKVEPNWHESMVGGGILHKTLESDGRMLEVYPSRMWPGDSVCDHLDFALHHDGVNLLILAGVFRGIDVAELTDHIRKKPYGMNNRRLWFLYEFIMGRRLELEDLDKGNYIDLIDSKAYYAADQSLSKRRSRQKINMNLLGDENFCPMVRRTTNLKRYEGIDFKARCEKITSAYLPEFLLRALSYLYTKETRSSFEIEHIQPDSNRMERFIALLQLAEKEDFRDKSRLIELQNRIVDSRFAAKDFREVQNYIGQTISPGHERVHYVCPRPQDIGDLMAGWLNLNPVGDGFHPVVLAAITAFGFVFLHPFEDGNGRIHRFLIHNVLARRGFTPRGLMFPISATMLSNRIQYDAALDDFSGSIAPGVDYQLDDIGRMTVLNDTRDLYRFMDLTRQTEFLFEMIEKTLEVELPRELATLASYDRARSQLQEIVDLPDRKMDLFIRLCMQNNGKLSAKKREEHFSMLTDDEIERMERVFSESGSPTKGF